MSENDFVREVNALTIMPLPVKIPASWYDTLPKVLPLIRWSTEQTRFFMGEELIDIFLQKWRKILIRREGDYVWLHLGGVACYEVIPNFIKGVKYRIDSSDEEIIENSGREALIKHWRMCIQELELLDDHGVLVARDEILSIIQPEMWIEELGKSWGSAAERAHANFGRIRPVIKNWIARYQDRCNLDEPFGGRLSVERHAAPDSGIV
jgi:hypothetical protein